MDERIETRANYRSLIIDLHSKSFIAIRSYLSIDKYRTKQIYHDLAGRNRRTDMNALKLLVLGRMHHSLYGFRLVHKPEYTEPTNIDLLDRLNSCNKLFEDGKIARRNFHHSFSCSLVRTPREGVLDIGKLFFIFVRFFFSSSTVLVTLKTISSFARIQTVAIDKNSTTADAYQLLRNCVCVPMNSNEDMLFLFRRRLSSKI